MVICRVYTNLLKGRKQEMKKIDRQAIILKEAEEDIDKAIRYRGLNQESNKQFYLGRVSGMVTSAWVYGDVTFYNAIRKIQDRYFD